MSLLVLYFLFDFVDYVCNGVFVEWFTRNFVTSVPAWYDPQTGTTVMREEIFWPSLKNFIFWGMAVVAAAVIILVFVFTERNTAKIRREAQESMDSMKEEQKYIYYACGETVDKIKLLPAMETLRDKGYEVLCLDDNIDEFCIKMLANYKEKEFKSIADADLGLDTEDDKEEIKKLSEENAALLTALGEALTGKVQKVELTNRLKSHPCCLRAEGPVTLEMEKVLNQQAMDDSQRVRAERVLELNASHPIFKKLCALQQEGSDQIKTYADILYTQALLIEGLPVDDPVAYANAVCDLIS